MRLAIWRGIFTFALVAALGAAVPVWADSDNDWENHRNGQVEEEIKKIGKELARTLIEELKVLERELQRMNRNRQQDRRR